MKKIVFALFFLLAGTWASAQQGTPEMADSFRSNGKIYVVFAVILTIFAGIIIYLVRLDRKMTRLERALSKN
jgi:tRNA(Phe) wybutosine-synthesizing methylase Tyw3